MSTPMGVWTLTCKKRSVFVHENHLPLSRQHLPGVPTAHDAIIKCQKKGMSPILNMPTSMYMYGQAPSFAPVPK